MEVKTTKIIYWTVTVIFFLANFLSGIAEFFPNQQGIEIMQQLGYPMYLFFILGIAKVLGSIAIIQTKFVTIKEWAYAGFTFDFIGATMSYYFIGADLLSTSMPLVFLAVMFISYYYWKQMLKIKK